MKKEHFLPAVLLILLFSIWLSSEKRIYEDVVEKTREEVRREYDEKMDSLLALEARWVSEEEENLAVQQTSDSIISKLREEIENLSEAKPTLPTPGRIQAEDGEAFYPQEVVDSIIENLSHQIEVRDDIIKEQDRKYQALFSSYTSLEEVYQQTVVLLETAEWRFDLQSVIIEDQKSMLERSSTETNLALAAVGILVVDRLIG